GEGRDRRGSLLLRGEELGEGGGLVAAIGVADATEHVLRLASELGVDLREVVLLKKAGREDLIEIGILSEESIVRV
ncbi:hypothetical protein PENTCL1PPCAC_30868, partial [Pristionchus entomophagus]